MKISFIQLFRLIFVVFSLYLSGDAFYRWDGFSYYGSFSEFLPSVALAFILWSIVSVVAAMIIWSILKVLQWCCNLAGTEIRIDHILFYALVFVMSGALAWKGKKLIWPDVQTTIQIKLAVLTGISILSFMFSWIMRCRTEQLMESVNERITPLVWLFGIFITLSVPLVSYHTWSDRDEMLESPAGRTFSEGKSRPNIILVTFDALAARNMSAYGYHRETTPFISRWSKNATVFAMAEAGSNFTTPAAASLMTGKRVWTHQTYHIAGTRPIRSRVESLPAVLKDYGYFNIALVVNPFASVNTLGMSDSFDIAPPATEFGTSASLFGWKFGIVDKMLFRVFGEKISMHNWIIKNDFIFSKVINLISRNIVQTPVPPEIAFNRFLNIIDDSLQKPFFAWIHIFPPHDPYLPPESFEAKFNDSREMRAYKPQERLIEESYKYLFQYKRVPEEMLPAVDLMRDYYDEYIAYIDKSFENFIEELHKRNIENTMLVLTADHGESFDHGYLTHGGPFLYEQVTHIPLLIKEPGQGTGQVVGDRVEQIDIPATILDLANLPVPSWMEGRSLVSIMRGEKIPPKPAFSMNFEENRSRGHEISRGSIALWDGDYKLIHHLEKDKSLLFNLNNDPGELRNIVDREPEISQKLLKDIKANLKKANALISTEKETNL